MTKDRLDKIYALISKSPLLALNLCNTHINKVLGEVNSCSVSANRECKSEEEKAVVKTICNKIGFSFNTMKKHLESPQTAIKQEKINLKQSKNLAIETLIRQQQAMLFEQEDVKNKFAILLRNIQAYVTKNWNKPNGCFVTYAWSSEDRPNESWIQKPFLVQFYQHLCDSGIKTEKLDNISNPAANNIYHFMQAAQTDDFVLLIGSELLMDKHKLVTSAVCNELILINRKRRADAQQGLYRVLPILLSGIYETSFPAYFELYTTIRDWREKPYLESLK
jgi:hypothetical protein